MGRGESHRLRLFASAVLVLAGATEARAQQGPTPPPAPRQLPPAQQSDEVVVLAPRSDEVRIDRRTYLIANDPIAQSTNMYDVLGRIPQVSIAPSGAITLLGAQGVTVQVNGQAVPGGSLEQILRGMTGSEIERIEVITNPSAQYSAASSGGIINIITRQRFSSGLTGSLSGSADSRSAYQVSASPTWTRGPWTLGGRINLTDNINTNESELLRQELSTGAITSETGRGDVDFLFGNGGLLGVYRPDDRHRASLSLEGFGANAEADQHNDHRDAAGLLYVQQQRSHNDNLFNRLVFDYQLRGENRRQLLHLNAALSDNESDSDTVVTRTPSSGALSQFATINNQATTGFNSRLDLEQPLPDDHFLTTGVAFDISDQTIDYALNNLIGMAAPNFASTLDGRQQTIALFATYQFETGPWTWLPGLRAEDYRREVSALGAQTDTTDLRFFPTLHVRRTLFPHLDLDLSYSSRIDRPNIPTLDPSVRFSDATHARTGNPNLRPTTIDAYEVNLTYLNGGTQYGVTFYERVRDDIVSPFASQTGAVTLSTFVNAGTSDERGLSFIARGPLSRRWRYSVNANFMNREADRLFGGVITRDSNFEYDGNAQLEFRDLNQSEIGADNLQFDLRFQGPRHTLQTEADEFFVANVSWRRRLTERLFSFVQVQDVFDSVPNTSRITTDTYFERSENRSGGTRVRVSLTYQFGAGAADRPPPAPDSGSAPSQ